MEDRVAVYTCLGVCELAICVFARTVSQDMININA
jgi:hypothetical protein